MTGYEPSEPSAQIRRFSAGLASLRIAPPLGLAVSGGPDSLALLLLAHRALPNNVAAATVDHGLREDAAEEARHVAAICRDLGIPHTILTADAPLSGASVQDGARRLRYALLSRWAADNDVGWIATAHHSDDQAETFLMRAARGSGLAGLAGIRPVLTGEDARDLLPHGGSLVRPLLDWRRDELAQVVADAGLTPVDDPSNCDPAYDRTRFRALLAREDMLSAQGFARSSANLAQAEEALTFAADRLWDERARQSENALELRPDGLPPELLRRLVLRAFATFGSTPRGSQAADLITTLSAGGALNIAGVHASGGSIWRFVPEAPRRAVSSTGRSGPSPTLSKAGDGLSRGQREAKDA